VVSADLRTADVLDGVPRGGLASIAFDATMKVRL